jgi:hypothetical protein
MKMKILKTKEIFTVKDEFGPAKLIRSHKKPLLFSPYVNPPSSLTAYTHMWCGTTQSTTNQNVTPFWMLGTSGISSIYSTSRYQRVSGMSGITGGFGTQGSSMFIPQSSVTTSQPQVNVVQIPYEPPDSRNINWNIMGEPKTYKYTIPFEEKIRDITHKFKSDICS